MFENTHILYFQDIHLYFQDTHIYFQDSHIYFQDSHILYFQDILAVNKKHGNPYL